MIARNKVHHPIPDRFDHSGRLMPERHRQGTRPIAVDDRKIRMAKARRLDGDAYFAGSRRRQFDLGDLDRAGPAIGTRGILPTQDGSSGSHEIDVLS